jgi:hypothetical protein
MLSPLHGTRHKVQQKMQPSWRYHLISRWVSNMPRAPRCNLHQPPVWQWQTQQATYSSSNSCQVEDPATAICAPCQDPLTDAASEWQRKSRPPGPGPKTLQVEVVWPARIYTAQLRQLSQLHARLPCMLTLVNSHPFHTLCQQRHTLKRMPDT